MGFNYLILMLRLKTIIFCLMAVMSTEIRAVHITGGEIGWKCQPNGKYVLIMRLYRDCTGVAAPSSASLSVQNHPSLTAVTLVTVGAPADLSPTGPGCLSCTNPSPGASITVELWEYRSAEIQLSGTPPPQGWIFSYSNCCRSTISNINSSGSAPVTLSAIMYANAGKNANPCYDSSPFFVEKPVLGVCSGLPAYFNDHCTDSDLDSLVYDWSPPLYGLTTFSPGYSYNSPFPGPAMNPLNVPGSLNDSTGMGTFTSYSTGVYLHITRVDAYRCGQRIASVFRDRPVIVYGNCGTNKSPVISAPFMNPVTGLFTEFDTTLIAGDTLKFTIKVTDLDSLPPGPPGFGAPQAVTVNFEGQAFGQGFSSPTACLLPPCATLSPVPPVTAVSSVSTNFQWVTGCGHASFQQGCKITPGMYYFFIRATDNLCAVPGMTMKTVSVLVLPDKVEAPDIRCVRILPNGNVRLQWEKPLAAPGYSFKYFKGYQVLRSSSGLPGSYSLLTTIYDPDTLEFTDLFINAVTAPLYYRLRSLSACDTSTGSAIATPILLTAATPGSGFVELKWNAPVTPKPAGSGDWYYIYREYPQGIWTLLDSTLNLHYNDPITACDDTAKYRIEIPDITGCVSISNVVGAKLAKPFSVIAGAPGVCPSQPGVAYSISLVAGAIAYAWIVPSGSVIVSGQGTPAIVVNFGTNPGNISVIVSSSNTTCAPGQKMVTILPTASPSVAIVLAKDSVCAGEPMSFTALPLNEGLNPSFQWYINGAATGSNSIVFTAILNHGDSVHCVITRADTCTAVGSAISNTQVVTVLPKPAKPAITVSGSDLTSSAATGYQWFLNGTPIAGASSQFYTAQVSGFYLVQVTAPNGCTAMSDTVYVLVTGISVTVQPTISINPNPMNTTLWVQAAGTEPGNTLITITGIHGREEYRQEAIFGSTNWQHEISTGHLARGVYFVRVQSGNSVKVLKVVKM
jgi:hypothetical protein